MTLRRVPSHGSASRLAGTVACLFVGAIGPACVPPEPAAAPSPLRPPTDVRDLPARPPVAVVVRDGDPRAAVAVAVLTAGVDDAAGARVPVALAAIAAARLTSMGFRDVTVAAAWDGFRVRALLPKGGDNTAIVRAAREALLAPILPTGSDVDAALAKLAVLARRPLRDPALAEAARCMDSPLATDTLDAPAPNAATLERWRAASDGLGRVVFGVAGTAHDVDAVTQAILSQPAWPVAPTRIRPSSATATSAAPRVYDASPEVAPGAARLTVLVHTRDPAVAVTAASGLGDPSGPLALRLRALDAPVVVRDITATAHADGGCVALTLELARGDSRSDIHTNEEGTLGALATAAALARQEATLSVARAEGGGSIARSAAVAGDPRDAADLAAWWALVVEASDGRGDEAYDRVVVGIGGGGDASPESTSRTKAVADEIEHAFGAWQANVIDARTAVEHGQGEVAILLASPCGTLTEGDADAGLTALAVAALVEQAKDSGRARNVDLSEWITTEGVGLVVRATLRDGESSRALGRRAADAAGAAFMAGTVEPASIARARAELMAATGQDEDARSFLTLAEALTPGHPSWTFPLTAGKGLLAWSDGAVTARVSALRHGPLRVAVLGNDDRPQVDATVLAVDRWAMRGTGTARSCPPTAPPPVARPGTYSAPPAVSSSAWIAIPLRHTASPSAPSTSASAGASSSLLSAARITAAALDGPDGLLAHALSSGLAYSWSAKVVGPRDASALVVHIGAASHTLDPAVAQVRALLDRLRRGGLSDADRARGALRLADEELRAALTPQGRLVRLWRGEPDAPEVPSVDALRSFLADTVRDEGLIIVASRPPLAKVIP